MVDKGEINMSKQDSSKVNLDIDRRVIISIRYIENEWKKYIRDMESDAFNPNNQIITSIGICRKLLINFIPQKYKDNAPNNLRFLFDPTIEFGRLNEIKLNSSDELYPMETKHGYFWIISIGHEEFGKAPKLEDAFKQYLDKLNDYLYH